MTSQGHPYARFRRALVRGNPTVATAAALELPPLALDDALRLVLLYHQAGDDRYERAALRWHARACGELRGIDLAGAAGLLQTLAALDRAGPEPLTSLLEGLGATGLVRVVDDAR